MNTRTDETRMAAERAGFWQRFTAALPMRAALLGVAAVWALGCVWSFQEQSSFAAAKGFGFPHLLPLVVDGFAASMAGVAWAASLDARPAVPARLATLVAVAGSSTSNGVWAWLRANQDTAAVVLGVAVPVAANLAFEVLLAELRRQVQRRRGLPPPAAVPYPRLIRLALAPWATFAAWRRLVLELTALQPACLAEATRTSASARQANTSEQPCATEMAVDVQPAALGDLTAVQAGGVQRALAAAVQPAELSNPDGRPDAAELSPAPDRAQLGNGWSPQAGQLSQMRRAFSPRDRATVTAELHLRQTGGLPTARELAALAQVSRGTAATAIKALRNRTEPDPAPSADQPVEPPPRSDGVNLRGHS